MDDTTSQSNPAALELHDVELSMFAAAPSSVAPIRWRVEPGEFWVVGGLMESGKTDLLATAAGLLPPIRGDVHIFGTALSTVQEEARLNLRLRAGLVHDGGRMLRHLSIAENIALPLRYHHDVTLNDVTTRLEPWLDATRLREFAHEASGRVGRNWAQRAGLARACILKPDLLLVDNPLSGLDPRHVQWWLEFLQQLSQGHPLLNYRKLTVVVTCDDFAPWHRAGRRFALLTPSRFRVLEPTLGLEALAEALISEA